MATDAELRNLFTDSDVLNTAQVACAKLASAILTEDSSVTNHSERAKLALAITEGYRDWAHKFLGVALMNYTEVAVQEIKNASSDAFQTAFEPFVTAIAVAKFGGQ